MNRRVFVSSALGAVAASAAQRPIRIGFLGASHSHAWAKVVVVRESPLWELVGVSEDAPVHRPQYQKAGIRLVSQEELLGDASVEVIAVESGVLDHAAHARLVLEAGKHVHLEKPPADNMEEFRELVKLARGKRRFIQLGYMWRYHPGINLALDAARNGWLGEVFLVRGVMNTLIPEERRPDWALFHGGQMFEQGCHLIDPMVRLLGRPERVLPVLRSHGPFNDGLADNTAAVFEYRRALGVVTSSVLHPNAGRHRAFEIFGSNGSAVVRPIEPPSLEIDLAAASGPYRTGLQAPSLPAYSRYVGEFEELARAVRSQGQLSVTLDEDLAVQEALLRASEMYK